VFAEATRAVDYVQDRRANQTILPAERDALTRLDIGIEELALAGEQPLITKREAERAITLPSAHVGVTRRTVCSTRYRKTVRADARTSSLSQL